MSKLHRLLYLLAFLKLLLPFFLQHSMYEPHRDEFLYLAEGRHMSLGYMEVPPVLSVFAWLTNLFGGGMFWIKFWPALFGALTFLLVGKLILWQKGRGFALLLGWLPFVLDGYLRLFFLFQPNFLEVFFWTLQAYALVRYVQTKKDHYLCWWGVAVGLGMMSKYSVAFYAIGLLAGLMITQERGIFGRQYLYKAGSIAALIFLPNFFWQFVHKFPVLHHMAELRDEQLQYVTPGQFLKGQLFMNLPCLLTWLAGLMFVWRNNKGRPFRFVGWAYVLVMVLLLVLHGKDYYALGAYPVLFAFGAVHLEGFSRLRFRWIRYALVFSAVGLGLYGLPVSMPLMKPPALARYYKVSGIQPDGFLWEDRQQHPLPQDFADMIGWREMTEKVAKVYHGLPADELSRTLIFCRTYAWAGALNYYGPQFGLPEVYSTNASFLLWLPDRVHVQNMILVGHDEPGKDDLIFQQFAVRARMDSLSNSLAREQGTHVFLFRQPKPGLDTLIEGTVRQLKSEFTR